MGRVFKENSVLERVYETWMSDSGRSEDLFTFIKHVPLAGTVLDCGCGSGEFTRLCAPYVDTIIGIDVSQTMIDKACAMTKDDNVSYHVMDMATFSFPHTFHRIIAMNDVLNFCTSLDQLKQVVNQVYTHLVRGGTFTFDVHHPQRMDEEGYSESGVLAGIDYEYMLQKEDNHLIHTFVWYENDYPTLETITQTLFDESELREVFNDQCWELTVMGDDWIEGFHPCEKWMIHARRKA